MARADSADSNWEQVVETAVRDEQRYHGFFKRRGLLMVPPLLFCLFASVGSVEHDAVVLPLGFAVFFVGVVIRFWAQLHLHYRLRVRKTLTTTGPYAWTRNPIYIGNTAVVLGLCIFSEVVYFLPVMLVWAVVLYNLVIRYEEAHLLTKYGKPYFEYMQQVARWVPSRPKPAPEADVRPHVLTSMWAETHNLLILLPFVLVEIFVG